MENLLSHHVRMPRTENMGDTAIADRVGEHGRGGFDCRRFSGEIVLQLLQFGQIPFGWGGHDGFSCFVRSLEPAGIIRFSGRRCSMHRMLLRLVASWRG